MAMTLKANNVISVRDDLQSFPLFIQVKLFLWSLAKAITN